MGNVANPLPACLLTPEGLDALIKAFRILSQSEIDRKEIQRILCGMHGKTAKIVQESVRGGMWGVDGLNIEEREIFTYDFPFIHRLGIESRKQPEEGGIFPIDFSPPHSHDLYAYRLTDGRRGERVLLRDLVGELVTKGIRDQRPDLSVHLGYVGHTGYSSTPGGNLFRIDIWVGLAESVRWERMNSAQRLDYLRRHALKNNV